MINKNVSKNVNLHNNPGENPGLKSVKGKKAPKEKS
jgi:hypothetical protein